MPGLRTIAENDLAFIVEDGVTGFGWPIILTDQSEVQHSLTGFSNDISQVIDPDTGQVVSGRLATVALRISSVLTATGGIYPVGIADESVKPWLVTFEDVNEIETITFKVIESNPDRALGLIILQLECYA